MTKCEFSGEECNELYTVEIAGAVMKVSPKYANLGKIISKPEIIDTNSRSKYQSSFSSSSLKQSTRLKFPKKQPKVQVIVVKNPASKIQSYMSKNNLTLKHIAHNANIKEGTLQKMMLGKIQFDVKMAQLIEKIFKIPLTQEVEENEELGIQIEDYLVDSESFQDYPSTMEEMMRDIIKDLKK